MYPDLFDMPIKQKEVRKGIIAYQYRNGVINIDGTKFLEYSMTEAIKRWRQKNPLR